MRDLSDRELEELSDGGAAEELYNRARRRDRQRREREAQARERAAFNALQSLGTETLQELARDPRTESDSRRRELWSAVPSRIWSSGWSKDRVVEEAQALAQERIEEQNRRRIRANTLPTEGVPSWVKLAGGAVLVGAALQKI